MQRTGRKGHAQFRIVVQDARQTPTSGKYVAMLGSYNPHTKDTSLVKDKAVFYLEHGAQPSERVARLFTQQGIKMPQWVKLSDKRKRAVRNQDKLRKNAPKGEKMAVAEKSNEDKEPPTSEQPPTTNEAEKSDTKEAAEAKPADAETKDSSAESENKDSK